MVGSPVNAQQEAVALWQFLEGRGFKPSVRMVARIMRDELGLGRRESLVREWLSTFSDASRVRPVSTKEASRMPLRAHSKVSLVSKPIIGAEPQSDSPAVQAALIPEAVKPVKKPAKPRAPYVVAECPYEDFEQIPTDDISELRAVAGDFAAHFANAGPDKVADHVGSYTTMLAKAAKMRRTVLEAWEACGKARLANGGAPLFKGLALRALDFLTYRPWNEAVPEPNSSDLLPTWPNGVPPVDPNFVDERPQWMIDEMNAAR
jgi:hypothetical protein